MTQYGNRLVVPHKNPRTPAQHAANVAAISEWAQNSVVNKILDQNGRPYSSQAQGQGPGAQGSGVVTIPSGAANFATFIFHALLLQYEFGTPSSTYLDLADERLGLNVNFFQLFSTLTGLPCEIDATGTIFLINHNVSGGVNILSGPTPSSISYSGSIEVKDQTATNAGWWSFSKTISPAGNLPYVLGTDVTRVAIVGTDLSDNVGSGSIFQVTSAAGGVYTTIVPSFAATIHS